MQKLSVCVGLALCVFLSLGGSIGAASRLTLKDECRLGEPIVSMVQTTAGSSRSNSVLRLKLNHGIHPVVPPDDIQVEAVADPGPALYFCDAARNFNLVRGHQTIVLFQSNNLMSTVQQSPSLQQQIFQLSASDPLPSETALVVVHHSIALCGRMGVQYTSNITNIAVSGEATLDASIQIEELSAQGDWTTVLATDTFQMTVLPGSPIIAEVAAASTWCVPQGAQMLVGSVGVRFPAMDLVLYDAWGNPALSTEQREHGTVAFRSHPPTTGRWSLPTAEDSVTTVTLKNSHSIVVDGLIINGTASHRHILKPGTADPGEQEHMIVSAATMTHASAPSHYHLELELNGIRLGGKTANCRRFELKPGPPHQIVVAPVGPYEQLYDVKRSEVAFTVPNQDTFHISVSVLDGAGNSVAPGPECGMPRPSKPFFDDFCLSCYTIGPMNEINRVNAVVAAGANATAGYFRLSPPSIGTTTVRCSNNATQPLFTISSTTIIEMVEHGNYDCHDGYTPFESILDKKSQEDVNAVFYDEDLRMVPMVKIEMLFPNSVINRHLDPLWTDEDTAAAFSAAANYGYKPMESDLFHWIIIPRKGFLYVPLGLLSAMSFGSSYTTVSSAIVNVTQPVCRDGTISAVRKAIVTWLFGIGDNSTAWYRRRTPAADPALSFNVNLQVCYGVGISELEFVSMYCCDRSGTRCESSTLESPLGVILLSGGLFLAVAIGAASCHVLWSTVGRTPVHLKPRVQLDMQEKSRVIVAHILAPFVLFFHGYFIFGLNGISANVLFALDMGFPVLWYLTSLLRAFFPLVVFVTPTQKFVGTAVLFYTQFLLGNCVIWTLCALHLNMKLLPYMVGAALGVLQVFWSIQAAENELKPSVLQEKVPQHSMVPIDAALSMEYFAIAVMLFWFAVSQVSDITPFGAVIASAVIVVFSSFWNYSLSGQFNLLFQKQFGKDATSATVMEKMSTEVRRQQRQAVISGTDDVARDFSASLLGAPLLRSPAPEDSPDRTSEEGVEMATMSTGAQRGAQRFLDTLARGDGRKKAPNSRNGIPIDPQTPLTPADAAAAFLGGKEAVGSMGPPRRKSTEPPTTSLLAASKNAATGEKEAAAIPSPLLNSDSIGSPLELVATRSDNPPPATANGDNEDDDETAKLIAKLNVI